MEKVYALLWDVSDPPQLTAFGHRHAARRVRIGAPDVPLPDQDPYAAMRATAPAAFASFWADNAGETEPLLAELRAAAGRVAAYAVAESVVLPNTAPAAGEREPGFLQVCAFATVPGLDRAALWRFWLGDHAKVAVETQSTSFYARNIVVRGLTPEAPAFDAIVEERFPAAALNRRDIYFAAEGDPGRQAENERRMAESCARFIDFGRITLMNCGEYRFGGWRDAG